MTEQTPLDCLRPRCWLGRIGFQRDTWAHEDARKVMDIVEALQGLETELD